MSGEFPLPFTAGWKRFSEGTVDGHRNPAESWAAPVDVAAFWWMPDSSEPLRPGHNRVITNLVLVVDSDVAVQVSPFDKFVVDGREFDVNGLPQDFDHGPFAFVPGVRPIDLIRVEG